MFPEVGRTKVIRLIVASPICRRGPRNEAKQANTGRLKEAAAYYGRVLEDAAPETAPFRNAAAGVLPALQARIPRSRLHATGVLSTDVVEIDGESVPVEARDEPHLLDPGTHVITVARAGVQRTRVTVSLDEGESHDVSLTIAPDAPPAATPASAPGLDLTAPVGSATPDRPHRSRNEDFSGNASPGLIHVP